jgi:hypothetical protein
MTATDQSCVHSHLEQLPGGDAFWCVRCGGLYDGTSWRLPDLSGEPLTGAKPLHEITTALIEDAGRYRYLRNADPDSSVHISLPHHNFGNWKTAIIGHKADLIVDTALTLHRSLYSTSSDQS